MITPMQHLTLLCRSEDKNTLLLTLREAGIVHLNVTRHLNHDLERNEEALKQAENTILKLEQLAADAPHTAEEPPAEVPSGIVREILCREQEIKDIALVDAKLQREQKQWEPFGDLDTRTLAALRDGGLHTAFLRAPGSTPAFPDSVTWLPARDGFGIALSTEPLPELPAEPIRMPVRGPATLRSRRDHLADLTRRHRQAILAHTASLPALRAYRDELTDICAFERAHLGMNSENGIDWITGFVPADTVPAVQAVADQTGSALFARIPDEDDPTPTLLKNNAVTSWIQPVFSFLGVTPGYNEVDVSWSFLLFLSIFSGIILGDAGYGLLLILFVATLNLLKPATRGKFANLLLSMGAATLIWGLLSGNIFGIEPAPVPALVPPLATKEGVMALCFIMGAGHLSLAHAWNLWRKRASLQALAELGWIGSTWSMYFITNQMVLNQPAPPWMPLLFTLSAVLIVLFMTPPAKFKAEWVQHMMLPLSFVNNFVDVVSYVRLYAVGMAGFALANSFNNMILAGGETRGWLLSGIMFLILILMHGLNFILAGLGVMVHGIRLNTLEFASHMNLTWSGIPYTPFTKTSKPNT